MNELGRAHIHAPGRLRHDHDLRRQPHFSAYDELLQVAAREARRRSTASPPHLTLNGIDHRTCEGLSDTSPNDSVRSPSRCAHRSATRCPREDNAGTAPRPEALLGHERQTQLAPRRRGRGVPRLGPRSAATRCHRQAFHPRVDASSSFCPLPDTPAMPTISPARTSSEDVLQVECRKGSRRLPAEVAQFEARFAGLARLQPAFGEVAAHHHPRQASVCFVARRRRARHVFRREAP